MEAAVCPAQGAKARRPDHGVYCLLTTPSGDHRLSSSQHQAFGRNRVLFPPTQTRPGPHVAGPPAMLVLAVALPLASRGRCLGT